MYINNKAMLAIAVALAMVLASCSGKNGMSTGATPESSAPQSRSKSATVETRPPEARGAVQRDYPSVAQEASLKLNYPLFQSYGKDSARITAFFPGASQRPVSIKLAPNAAGYALTSEGNECKFPLHYDLTAADGKLLESGEYKQQPITLAGWGAQSGVAVLAVRMADGAPNNYGCNLVVTKK